MHVDDGSETGSKAKKLNRQKVLLASIPRLASVQRTRFCLSDKKKNVQEEEEIKVGTYNSQGGSRQKHLRHIGQLKS